MTNTKRYRIGFVVPRYGEEILGGAETFVRCLAEQLVAEDRVDVEVLTTCVRSHITWQNELPPGKSMIQGVPVHRFLTDPKVRNEQRYEELHRRLIQRELLPVDEQYEWFDHNAHSPQLYAYLETHGNAFDFLIFIPYLTGMTFYGSAIHPLQSILWPCFHDEIYAYLRPIAEMYRSCLGIMFNAYPEKRLANRLYGPHPGGVTIGFGFEPYKADPERFCQQHDLKEPFILYSGRLEGGKNVPLLIQNFIEYKRHNATSWKLVLMGKGEPVPAHPDIIPIGFRQGQEKLDGYTAASLLCQPSVNESFSIVIMESWLSRVPVLVHSDCDVTRYHAEISNGGLHFRNYDEFEAILNFLALNDDLRKKLGYNGQQYVQTQYGWKQVLGRFYDALDHWNNLRSSL